METPLRRLGNFGEDLAADFLRRKGYRIIARQQRVGRMGELDLVCTANGRFVFVEVKTRTSAARGAPEESVTPRKRECLRKAILGWLQARGLPDAPCRLDVVAIDLSGPAPRINHIEGVGA